MEEFRALFSGQMQGMSAVQPKLPDPVEQNRPRKTEAVDVWEMPSIHQAEEAANAAAQFAKSIELPKLDDVTRASAWNAFRDFCVSWIDGFDEEGAEQPDRLQMMQDLGQGALPVPILVMAYEQGSLQQMVGKALLEYTQKPFIGLSTQDAYHEYIDKVSSNMVQISHMGFPDLAGTYDYSTKWKRS
jgi:hypothetical protein